MAKKVKKITLDKKKDNALTVEKKYQHRMVERAKEIKERIKERERILQEMNKQNSSEPPSIH